MKSLSKCLIVLLLLFHVNYGFNVYAKTNILEIIHTNDTHGMIFPFKQTNYNSNKLVGGIARRYTLIKALKKASKDNNLLLLDAGDIAQGGPLYYLYSGKPDIKFMNDVGYDAAELGNHEFDRGNKSLLNLINEAKFPFLAANLKFNKDSILYDKIKPFIIKDFKNMKVGIIGLITEDVKIISNISDDITVLDTLDTAQKYINKLRNKTDVIILLTHIGYTNDKYLASATKGVNIIVGGHSHTLLKKPTVINDLENKPVIIVQDGEFGEYLGNLKVEVKNKNTKLISYELIHVDDNITPDNDYFKNYQSLTLKIEELINTKIGSNLDNIDFTRQNIRRKETNGGNLIVDAMINAFPQADIAICNGGSLRINKILQPGDISLYDIKEICPFEEPILLYKLKGKDIKLVLERSVAELPNASGGFLQVSGVSFDVDVSKKPQKLSKNYTSITFAGERVSNITVNNTPLDYNKVYTVASNTFLANGGNAFWAIKYNAKDIIDTKLTTSKVLEAYIKKYSPISPGIYNRINIYKMSSTYDED